MLTYNQTRPAAITSAIQLLDVCNDLYGRYPAAILGESPSSLTVEDMESSIEVSRYLAKAVPAAFYDMSDTLQSFISIYRSMVRQSLIPSTLCSSMLWTVISQAAVEKRMRAKYPDLF